MSAFVGPMSLHGLLFVRSMPRAIEGLALMHTNDIDNLLNIY